MAEEAEVDIEGALDHYVSRCFWAFTSAECERVSQQKCFNLLRMLSDRLVTYSGVQESLLANVSEIRSRMCKNAKQEDVLEHKKYYSI